MKIPQKKQKRMMKKMKKSEKRRRGQVWACPQDIKSGGKDHGKRSMER